MRTSERSLWAFMVNRYKSSGGNRNLLSPAAVVKVFDFAVLTAFSSLIPLHR
jgi:hypothetical protein